MATLLCQADLYDEAADLLLAFDLSLEAPIVQLAKKYACAIGRPDAQEIELQLTGKFELFATKGKPVCIQVKTQFWAFRSFLFIIKTKLLLTCKKNNCRVILEWNSP